jgi:hypothetical protein
VDFREASQVYSKISAAFGPGSQAACDAMLKAFQNAVKHELSRYPHAPHTRTPAPVGQPPGMISGKLRESVTIRPAAGGGGRYEGYVGPHTIYARYMEFGGWAHATNRKYMSWVTDGRRYYRKTVISPPRPYMRPVSRRLSADGQLSEAAWFALGAVVYPVEV